MPINKEYLKQKVIQGINVMPTVATVVRANKGKYRDVEKYTKLFELTGCLYRDDNYQKDITINDKGISENLEVKTFLLVYDDNTKQLKEEDLFIMGDKVYQLVAPNENMEIYLEALLKYTKIKYSNNKIIKNSKEYEVI